MKKIFACVLAVCPMVASADYLDDKIAALTKEKLDKIAKLEECQKSTKGLKIAGITTLGVSAIGIGANIGEAVALKNYDAKINTAVQTKSDLDVQIIDAQRKKAEEDAAKLAAQSGVNLVNQPVVTPGVDVNNTCGTKTCDAAAPTQSGLDLLNATEAVCKDGNWVAKTCKENYSGTQQTCTLNGATVTYIDSCRLTAPTEKQCPQVTDEWKAQNNAKSGACDTTTGQLYITECADTHTEVKDANGRITECQQKQEQTQPVVQERKHHEMCTAEETVAIPNAATAWWYNGKCVAKSCKPNTYLHVKNGVSQGQCMTACPAWQIINWANGGQACDVAKTKPVDPTPVQETCARVNQIASNDSSCKSQCAKFATDNKCFWNQQYLWKNNICICSPTDADRREVEKFVPNVPVQKNDTTTVVTPQIVEPIKAPEKPGRDMGGAAIYYKQAVKGQDIHPYVEIDGKKYQGYATAGIYSTRPSRALENLREKLEDAGYSNFNLVAGY